MLVSRNTTGRRTIGTNYRRLSYLRCRNDRRFSLLRFRSTLTKAGFNSMARSLQRSKGSCQGYPSVTMRVLLKNLFFRIQCLHKQIKKINLVDLVSKWHLWYPVTKWKDLTYLTHSSPKYRTNTPNHQIRLQLKNRWPSKIRKRAVWVDRIQPSRLAHSLRLKRKLVPG